MERVREGSTIIGSAVGATSIGLAAVEPATSDLDFSTFCRAG